MAVEETQTKIKRVVLLYDINPAMFIGNNVQSLTVEFVRCDLNEILDSVTSSEDKVLYLWDLYDVDIATAAFKDGLSVFGYSIKEINDYRYQEGDVVYVMFTYLDYEFFRMVIRSRKVN